MQLPLMLLIERKVLISPEFSWEIHLGAFHSLKFSIENIFQNGGKEMISEKYFPKLLNFFHQG
jgi:hypothetical protein